MNVTLSDKEACRLIKKTAAGDEKAFRVLYEAINKMVYFYLFRLMKNEHTAEEIMVQTFTEVWKNAEKFKGKSKVTTWVIGIARNIAMKEFKDIKKHASHDNIGDYKHIEDKKGTPSDFSDKKEVILRSMEKLSDKHREVLDMFFFCEMSYNDIAVALGVSINTVKSRIFYAKKELKTILKEMGIGRDEL